MMEQYVFLNFKGILHELYYKKQMNQSRSNVHLQRFCGPTSLHKLDNHYVRRQPICPNGAVSQDIVPNNSFC